MLSVTKPIFSSGQNLLKAIQKVSKRFIIGCELVKGVEVLSVGQISEQACQNFSVKIGDLKTTYFFFTVVGHVWDKDFILDPNCENYLAEIERFANQIQEELGCRLPINELGEMEVGTLFDGSYHYSSKISSN